MIQTKQGLDSWLSGLYAVLFVLLPWSSDFSAGSWHIHLPSEVLMVLLGPCLLWCAWQQRARTPHLSLLGALGIAWVAWMAISVCTSSILTVSVKYWIVETGQWWIFFAGLVLLPGFWRRLLPVFICSMAFMVVYVLFHHAAYHFRSDQSVLAVLPFFSDHTLYSAVLVMLLPFLPLYFKKPVAIGLIALFLAGLIFAACRAAWMSVVVTLLLLLPLVFRKKRNILFLYAGVLLLGAGVVQRYSTTWLAGDISSLERLNRYACAWRMAAERPVTGFGPGTFQFAYLPFQEASDMTRISITDPEQDIPPGQFGRGGGAHSEYFQALAENGWPGFVLWLSLVLGSIFTGVTLFLSTQDRERQYFTLAVCASLLTFFIHTLFNNFLHDGRIAILVWGQMAWLCHEANRVKGKGP